MRYCSVPGAFTPTFPNGLPGFVQHFDEFREGGIDVYCVSVNDPFVMQAWGKWRDVTEGLQMLADGNADFTRALGLEMDASGYGMGVRSKRYRAVCRRRCRQAALGGVAGRIPSVFRRARPGKPAR